jgi:hypothetical protein
MFRKILLLLMAITVSLCSTVLSDVEFAFSAEVDAEWRLEKIDSSTVCIYNSEITKKTKLYIGRIVVDTVSVIKDFERAQMYFLSNYAVAKQYGIVQSFDSTTTLRQGNLRAYELYAYFNDTENGTNLWWAEISRWCAIGNYVFELTVIGDTGDVNNNGKQYKSMLNGIQIGYPSTTTTQPVLYRFIQQPVSNSADVFDLFGRKMNKSVKPRRNAATGCFVAPMRMVIKLR